MGTASPKRRTGDAVEKWQEDSQEKESSRYQSQLPDQIQTTAPGGTQEDGIPLLLAPRGLRYDGGLPQEEMGVDSVGMVDRAESSRYASPGKRNLGRCVRDVRQQDHEEGPGIQTPRWKDRKGFGYHVR